MGIITAQKAANYFIWFSHKHGDTITNLKLQKLVYYAQAWYLALYNKPLFDERLEAWTHGPVQPDVYKQIKLKCDSGWNPIEVDISRKPSLPEHAEAHIEEVYRVYGGFSAFDLERMTHQEEPWLKARGGLPIDAPSNNVISLNDMKHYYRKRIEEKNK